VGIDRLQAQCVPNLVSPSTPPLQTTTPSHQSTSFASIEQNLAPFYVYLVIEMPYAEFIEPSTVFFTSDFSQFLSPGLQNVEVIMIRHEAFNYGQRLDPVKSADPDGVGIRIQKAVKQSRREANSM
jgi:hypothetical protein